MKADAVMLTASTIIGDKQFSTTLPVPQQAWDTEHMRSDYMLIARTRLGSEIVRHLDVTFTTDGADDE